MSVSTLLLTSWWNTIGHLWSILKVTLSLDTSSVVWPTILASEHSMSSRLHALPTCTNAERWAHNLLRRISLVFGCSSW